MQTFCVLPAFHNRKYLLGLRICLLTLHRKFSAKTKCPARVGKKCIPLAADLTEQSEVASLFAQAESACGPIEVLIANAGYWPPNDAPIQQMTLEQWNQTIAVDLTSVFLCMRQFFRGIVNHR